jgi:hypothetical protein
MAMSLSRATTPDLLDLYGEGFEPTREVRYAGFEGLGTVVTAPHHDRPDGARDQRDDQIDELTHDLPSYAPAAA